MSRVVITELLTGDVNLAANANATLTSWNAASTDVDDQNVRDEGIDRRPLKKEFQVFGDTVPFVQKFGLFYTVAAAAYTEITPTFKIGGFNYDSPSELLVRCSMEYAYSNVASLVLSIRLGWSSGSGGAITPLPATERNFRIDVVTGGTINRGVYTVTHRLTGVTDPDVWFRAQAKVSLGTASLSDGYFSAIMHPK